MQDTQPTQKNFSFATILVLLLLVLTGFLAYQYWNLRKEVTEQQTQERTENRATSTPSAFSSPQTVLIEDNKKDEIKTEPQKSSIVDLDATWKQYTNPTLGFSINFPAVSSYYAGSCEWSEKNGDHSYRYVSSNVNNAIVEDSNAIYITAEALYVLGGETTENYKTYYSSCQKELLTLPTLQKERRTWNILVRKAENDQDVENFVKDRFGSGCSLGEKKETTQTGVFEVFVKGDGKDLSETACPINYAFEIRYAPEKKKLYSWDLGQEVGFWNEKTQKYYNTEMVESFKVL